MDGSAWYIGATGMEATAFDEHEFFRAISASGARALLIDDLILTKRFGARPKDAEDVRLLEALRGKGIS